ncbi:hypothetical protein [Amycolatopsis sp. 3B14]
MTAKSHVLLVDNGKLLLTRRRNTNPTFNGRRHGFARALPRG